MSANEYPSHIYFHFTSLHHLLQSTTELGRLRDDLWAHDNFAARLFETLALARNGSVQVLWLNAASREFVVVSLFHMDDADFGLADDEAAHGGARRVFGILLGASQGE